MTFKMSPRKEEQFLSTWRNLRSFSPTMSIHRWKHLQHQYYSTRCEQHISDFFFLLQLESEQLGPAHVIRTMFRVNCACATTQHCCGRDNSSSPPAFSCTTSSKVLRRLLLIICESLLDPAVCKRMGLPRANKNSFCSLSVSHGFLFQPTLSYTLPSTLRINNGIYPPHKSVVWASEIKNKKSIWSGVEPTCNEHQQARTQCGENYTLRKAHKWMSSTSMRYITHHLITLNIIFLNENSCRMCKTSTLCTSIRCM